MAAWLRLLAYDVSADKSSRLFADIAPWLIVLVAVVLVGGVAIFVIRRWLKSEPTGSGGFTLQDLRDMYKAGELSDEEFERAKAQMIGRLKSPASAAKPTGPDASPGNSDS